MSQLDSAINIANAISSKDFNVRARQCVRVCNRNASCSACIDVCPSNCIVCADNELGVNWDECVGCGACIVACPVEVFSFTGQSDTQLVEDALAAAKESNVAVAIVCQAMYSRAKDLVDVNKILVVPCLGRIDETMLVRIASCGINSISLVHFDCESCFNKTSGVRVETVTNNAKELLKAWGNHCKVQVRGKLPTAVRRNAQEEFDEDKRAFFKNIKEESRQVASIVATTAIADAISNGEDVKEEPYHVLEDGTLPKANTLRRAQLLTALDAMLENNEQMQEGILHSGIFYRVSIDRDTCKSCRMCANFCPVGALRKFQTSDSKLGVIHTPALCVGCKCCQDICPSKSLKLFAVAKTNDVTERKTYAYYMNKPPVEFNRPDTMFNTVRNLIDSDQISDLQR